MNKQDTLLRLAVLLSLGALLLLLIVLSSLAACSRDVPDAPDDFYVLDDWRLGKLGEKPLQEFAESEKAKAFLRWGAVKPEECAACPYGTICNGGCKNDWYTDAEERQHNYYCAAFRALLDHALPRMRQIARAERNARMQRG